MRRAGLLAFLMLTTCATPEGRKAIIQALEIAAVVQDVDVMPDQGYVVNPFAPPLGPHKFIRVEFVRPVERGSIDLTGFSVLGFRDDGTTPPALDVAGLHFDDDPSDTSTSGQPALSIGIDLDDADIEPGAMYTFVFEQPGLLFQGDPTPSAVSFEFPPFRASAAGPDAEWPFVADLEPGPEPPVPGWGAPVTLADLPVLGDPNSFQAPVFLYMPPHAEMVMTFSEDMASAILLPDPLDPAVQFVPTPLGPQPPELHPARFREMRSLTATGLIPA